MAGSYAASRRSCSRVNPEKHDDAPPVASQAVQDGGKRPGLRERLAAAAGDSVDVELGTDGPDDFVDIQDHPTILLQGSGRDAAGAPEGTPLKPDGGPASRTETSRSDHDRVDSRLHLRWETFTARSVPAWAHEATK